MTFRPFNPLLCNALDIVWYQGFPIPKYRTVEVVGIKILKTDSIVFKNANGQIINIARATGTDKENVKGLKTSFLSQGWDDSKLPPIVEESDLTLYDGFSRQEALLQIGQDYGFYLVVRRKPEFDIEDVIDEIGLGANNHSQHKKANMRDFKKRLARFISRSEKTITIKEAKKWFAGIPNSFTDEYIETAIIEVFNRVGAAANMEAFDKPDAEKKAAELLKKQKNKGIIAIGKGVKKRGSYLKRCVTDAIFYYADHGTVPEFVSFLKDIPAENAEVKRKELELELKSINEALIGLFFEYKKNPNFKVIDFKGHLPQIIDQEEELVNY